MKENIICIVCPKGCIMEIVSENGTINVSGNGCKRGIGYGIKEITAPTRTLTTTVKIKNAVFNRLPVVTKGEIPKNQLFEAMKIINAIEVTAPIEMGHIIIEDLLGLGIRVVASRDMNEQV